MTKAKVLYVYRDSGHHYKELDYQILSLNFDVERLAYAYNPASVRRLIQALKQVDGLFFWFASPFSALGIALAKKQGVPTVTVSGGYDVANYPPLRHGARYQRFQKRITRYALENSDLVLPVSEFNERELLSFACAKKRQMIYNGVDVDFSKPLRPNSERLDQIITVGSVEAKYSKLKGHHHFAQMAKRMSGHARFVLVGPVLHKATMHELQQISGGCIEFRGRMPHNELMDAFSQSKIYLQLSLYESFGLTIPEAMAFGCTPIVSRCGALPEVVGSFGYIHEPDDYNGIGKSILSALKEPPHSSEVLRARAATFSAKCREKSLLEACSRIFSKKEKPLDPKTPNLA